MFKGNKELAKEYYTDELEYIKDVSKSNIRNVWEVFNHDKLCFERYVKMQSDIAKKYDCEDLSIEMLKCLDNIK